MITDVHNNLDVFDLRENRRNESHTLLTNEICFLFVLPTFIHDSGKIGNKIAANTAVDICTLRENRRGERRTFHIGVNKITFNACIVKSYNNLNLKNALVSLHTT
jgi:hypothetical protein